MASKFCAASCRKLAWRFEKATSIGFKSEEYGGKRSNHAPRYLIGVSVLGHMWKATYSRMKMSLVECVGASWVYT